MEFRTLGQTGLKVSALGFGAATLGGVYGQIDPDSGTRAVRTALDLGINFFDVAPYYGLTRAESALGTALRGVPRDRFILSTKVGRYDKDLFDFSASRVAASVDESLARLGVDHVDLLYCHDVEFASLDQIIGETLPALRRLRERGKVRFLGVSGLPLKIFTEVLARTELDAVLSYCRYTMLDTSLVGLVPLLEEKGVGVVNASPLGMGLLSRAGPRDWHPAPAEVKDAALRAAAHCAARQKDLAELALRYAVEVDFVHTTLVGMRSAEEVRKNVATLGKPMDMKLLSGVSTILAPARNVTWPSGREENQDEE